MNSGNMVASKKSPAIIFAMASVAVLLLVGIVFGLGASFFSKATFLSPARSFVFGAENRSTEESYLEMGKPIEIWDANAGTKFLVTFKDAWYSDRKLKGEDDKRVFYVVYSYHNLGPREGKFFFRKYVPWEKNIELTTSDKCIYEGNERVTLDAFPAAYEDWEPKETKKIGDIGEEALVFNIPKTSVPVEFSVKLTGKALKVKLPGSSFDVKKLSMIFYGYDRPKK